MDYSENRGAIAKVVQTINLYPERIAFVIEDKEYTYQQLSERISGLLYEIRQCPDKRLGIIAYDSIDTYAAILATLISGKTYVILHPEYPKDRNNKIVSSAKLNLVLGAYAPNEGIIDINAITYLHTDSIPSRGDKIQEILGSENDYAYIIFTSGSTGEPKGVPISRKNLNSFYDAYKKLNWRLDAEDRMLQMFELTFDVSIVSFLYPLTLGASIYTVGYKDVKHFKVIDIIERYAITFAAVTPSLLQLISPYYSEINLPSIKYLIVTAEASQMEVIKKFQACAPNAQFVNLYGPTEATIYCSVYKIPRGKSCKHYNGMIAVGKPFEGIDAIIIDEDNQVLANGEKGELLISGGQVMTGYLNDKKKSEEALVKLNGKIYYKTGDLCVIDDDGDLIYCGRKDHQVKIQGYRIELSEIEYTAKEYFRNNRNAIVLSMNNQNIGKELWLLIEGGKCQENEVYKFLEDKLPSYMLPKKILFMDKFPQNNSNKIDRKRITELINNLY